MARYKYIDTNPRFLAVDLAKQLLPGTFEHALNHLLDHGIDLSHFDARFRNDATGAPAYPPALLLKVVLFAYSQGIVGSRGIERACQEHVTFIALCGDTAPHFTTIAHFISTLQADIARVFAGVLAVCAREGLIGREMFAIDGVKLPSNASKRRSGTRADFAHEAAKLITRLEHDAAELRDWLAANPKDRHGSKGAIRKSNRTDNDSAKMATGKGVIQGYTGVAAVDGKHQIIVEAQAHGTGSEQEALLPVVTVIQPQLAPGTCITADAGYHSEANLEALAMMQVTALIADGDLRRRDERFATQGRYQDGPDPLYDKTPVEPTASLFQPSDFTYDPEARTCVCPAGKSLYRTGRDNVINGYVAETFRGAKQDCVPCALRALCLRTPEKTLTRQVAFFRGRDASAPETHTARMKAAIDAPAGRARYAQRFAAVEPVFANLRHNKGLDRFTLRGRTKVDAQWKLFCLVHNIEKLANNGYAA
jgi:transposase